MSTLTSSLPFPLTSWSETHDALLNLKDVKPAPLPVPSPTKSFWLDSARDINPLAKQGNIEPLSEEADVCIIGSGITGVSAAYHLSRLLTDKRDTPLRVIILEARDFCSGATGRNGGHLTAVTFQEFASYAEAHGIDEAHRAIALEKHVMSDIVDLVKAAGKEDEVDLVGGGNTTAWLSDEEASQGMSDYEAAKKAGANLSEVQLLSKEEMLAKYGAAFPGAHTPGYNVWPLKLVTHLYYAAAASSAITLSLHTNTPVTSISPLPSESFEQGASPRWSVQTPHGAIRCAYVLHATNAYASHLLPHFAGPSGIVPTRAQVSALRAVAPASTITASAWGGNNGFEYWFPRPPAPGDGADAPPLVIFGGGRETARPNFELDVADDASVSVGVGKMLREFLPAVFPGLYEQGREPEMEWTGIMGFTRTGDPFVGSVFDDRTRSETFKGQYIAAGYTGHGMTRAYGCAEAIAQMMVADMLGEAWTIPEWLPRHYLTENRL